MYKLLALLLLIPGIAVADKKPKKPPKPPTAQEQNQHQGQSQYSKNDNRNYNRNSNHAAGGDGGDAYAAALAGAHSDASAISDNTNTVDNTDYVDVITDLQNAQDQSNAQNVNFEGSPVVTLVPNNNTENCLRVIGLSFANSAGGGGLGWPFRSKKCDYEQAADDAFAQGQFKIGWMWKCKNKNLWKSFGSPENCLTEHMNMFVTVPPKPHPAPIDIDVNACCKDKRKCGSDHPEIHKRIYEKCQSK